MQTGDALGDLIVRRQSINVREDRLLVEHVKDSRIKAGGAPVELVEVVGEHLGTLGGGDSDGAILSSHPGRGRAAYWRQPGLEQLDGVPGILATGSGIKTVVDQVALIPDPSRLGSTNSIMSSLASISIL